MENVTWAHNLTSKLATTIDRPGKRNIKLVAYLYVLVKSFWTYCLSLATLTAQWSVQGELRCLGRD